MVHRSDCMCFLCYRLHSIVLMLVCCPQSFNLVVKVSGLREDSSSLKIRMLPGPLITYYSVIVCVGFFVLQFVTIFSCCLVTPDTAVKGCWVLSMTAWSWYCVCQSCVYTNEHGKGKGLSTCYSGGYRGGSPTAVQAWRTCPLWEPSLHISID